MSEYWKSNPRKFCQQCKVWITDNKLSVQFHESGKKHKEAVEAQLKDARKRSAAKRKEQDELGDFMESLEKKARVAVLKDGVGASELSKSKGASKKISREVEVVNQAIYKNALKKEEKEEEKKLEETTGLGQWESLATVEPEPIEVDPDELPKEPESFVVREKKYEVKTHQVIEDLGIEEGEGEVMRFKKRRARNIRKKTTND